MQDESLNRMKQARQVHGVSAETLESSREVTREWRLVEGGLAQGPATIPELAERIGLDTARTFWLVNALRKYGRAETVGAEGSYLRYRLIDN